ncbi:class I SAM-dependent methyltransferase [uncultured Bifidobacterium sp.]|uniref:class I SAM-dependent methyltransferase n=1 Tax=uncultured Bifidobacterium sp. TaxID=165187 RepID=UPI0026099AEA|nr:class I SAM-dependent methyltransferase [uncultured Bifidobacterium sp.]
MNNLDVTHWVWRRFDMRHSVLNHDAVHNTREMTVFTYVRASSPPMASISWEVSHARQEADQSGDVRDNLLNWNDRAVVHANGAYGDRDAFADDPSASSPVVLRDLAVLEPHLPESGITGLRLQHLQCHIGEDTLTWWRLGAGKVYGLDFSPTALEYARNPSERAGASITYVQGGARFAAQAMPDQAGRSISSSPVPEPSPGFPI